MIEIALALLLGASKDETPVEAWNCRNQIEIWCAADGCAATSEAESTPMDIWASVDGAISVCAYSGCWEGSGAFTGAGGRLLWGADSLPFTTSPDGAKGDVTLLVLAEDGVGFVRAGGLATPVLCRRAIRVQPE